MDEVIHLQAKLQSIHSTAASEAKQILNDLVSKIQNPTASTHAQLSFLKQSLLKEQQQLRATVLFNVNNQVALEKLLYINDIINLLYKQMARL